jgi:hypothetical protein
MKLFAAVSIAVCAVAWAGSPAMADAKLCDKPQ